mmetsp:Transcript_39086/g.70004  ORF Transcript_39086/g.70004 Transcript_39086/m.70004 type:complete len:350 (-) Transcript_39086:54-1103(-)
MAAGSLGVRVELDHGTQVLQGVLLHGAALLHLLGLAHYGLDLIRVDDTGHIRVAHHVAGHLEALLHVRLLLGGAKDGVQLLHGSLGVDDKATEVTAGSQLQQVQAVDASQLHARQITEGLGDALIGGIHHQGALAANVAAVPHLTLAATQVHRGACLLGVILSTDGSHHSQGLASLLQPLSVIGHHKGHLSHLVNLVATRHHQRRHSSGGQSRADSVALKVNINLAVPPTPGLVGRKHAATAAHIAKCTLACAVGTTTRHAGNTGHSATSTPRLGRRLHAGSKLHGIRLASVLVHASVHLNNDVGAQGGRKHRWQGDLLGGGRAIHRLDGNHRACGGHGVVCSSEAARQ